MHRRRVWSEEVPLETLRSRPVLDLCGRYGLEVLVAVRPFGAGRGAELSRTLAALTGAGLAPAIWPMLDDASGRWANAENAAIFAAFVDRLVESLEAEGTRVREIALDLEPSIERLREVIASPAQIIVDLWRWRRRTAASLEGGRIAAARSRDGEARQVLGALCSRLEGRGITTSAALLPTLLFDEGAERAWEAILGTPTRGLPLSHASVMLYTSIFEGWSRGLLDRGAAREILGAGARAAAARFGPQAGVSLGAVGVGAFGDEPVYRSAKELADDVGIARAAGVDDLTLLDLGGVLARPRPEEWLEAFVATPPAAEIPVLGARARGVLGVLRASTRVVRALAR